MTTESIKSLNLGDMTYEYFGIRVDDCVYSVGDTANNSHQLFQDPEFDENDELIHPEGVGIYSGFYDAGELAGTCCIGFDPDDNADIQKALEMVTSYSGIAIHIIAGNYAEYGIDEGEIIIRDAIIVALEIEDLAASD